MIKERRIYVIVAETVQPEPGPDGFSIDQVPGRIAAQCAHVVSKVRVRMFAGCSPLVPPTFGPLDPITTIVLSVNNSKELRHVQKMMHRLGYAHETFFDTNEDVYGYDHEANVR